MHLWEPNRKLEDTLTTRIIKKDCKELFPLLRFNANKLLYSWANITIDLNNKRFSDNQFLIEGLLKILNYVILGKTIKLEQLFKSDSSTSEYKIKISLLKENLDKIRKEYQESILADINAKKLMEQISTFIKNILNQDSSNYIVSRLLNILNNFYLLFRILKKRYKFPNFIKSDTCIQLDYPKNVIVFGNIEQMNFIRDIIIYIQENNKQLFSSEHSKKSKSTTKANFVNIIVNSKPNKKSTIHKSKRKKSKNNNKRKILRKSKRKKRTSN